MIPEIQSTPTVEVSPKIVERDTLSENEMSTLKRDQDLKGNESFEQQYQLAGGFKYLLFYSPLFGEPVISFPWIFVSFFGSISLH